MPASTAPAGMLTLQLELRPAFSAALDELLLKSQQRMEHARDADVMASFVARAKVGPSGGGMDPRGEVTLEGGARHSRRQGTGGAQRGRS